MPATATCRWSSALFFGLKAAVLAIVLEAVFRIGKRSLKNNAMIGARGGRVRRHLLLRRPVSGHHLRRGADRLRRRARRASPRFRAAAATGSGKQGSRRCRQPARRRAARACAADRCAGAAGRQRLARAVAGARDRAAAHAWEARNVFSQIAVFFSKMAMVTFGGAYAVLAYVAQQAVENYGWLKPGEMLDGLGMAETTPGPADHGAAVRGLHGGVSRSGHAAADAGRHARRPARDLGDVHALLPLDLPRRAVHRGAARQQGAQRRAVGDHRGGGRRDPEPRDLVRDPHRVSRGRCPCARSGLSFDAPVLRERRSVGARHSRSRRPSPSSASRSG